LVTPKRKRTLIVAAAVLAPLTFAVFSSSARASTASVEVTSSGFTSVTYQAASGEQNNLTVTTGSGSTIIEDSGAVISAEPGCEQVDAHEVTCPESDAVDVFLDDRNDVAAFPGTGAGFVHGEAGNDHLTVSQDFDFHLFGEDGDDVLDGFSADGGAGNDTITSPAGEISFLDGRSGNDTITGSIGQDLIRPGAGDDVVDGGPGSMFGMDTVIYHGGRPVLVNLATGVATGQGLDTLSRIGKVQGTRFADILIGNPSKNVLQGGGGADVIVGRGEDDRLRGGPGPDFLRGGKGADRLYGGVSQDSLLGEAGNDRLIARDGRRDVVKGGAGRDKARIDRRRDLVSGVEAFF
jgi:Ca2+-binding RTX toxin-like protein